MTHQCAIVTQLLKWQLSITSLKVSTRFTMEMDEQEE